MVMLDVLPLPLLTHDLDICLLSSTLDIVFHRSACPGFSFSYRSHRLHLLSRAVFASSRPTESLYSVIPWARIEIANRISTTVMYRSKCVCGTTSPKPTVVIVTD